jgi:hypothetical protein
LLIANITIAAHNRANTTARLELIVRLDELGANARRETLMRRAESRSGRDDQSVAHATE